VASSVRGRFLFFPGIAVAYRQIQLGVGVVVMGCWLVGNLFERLAGEEIGPTSLKFHVYNLRHAQQWLRAKLGLLFH
jgi:hypothetical protein